MLLIQVLNALSYSFLLFLVAVGMALTMGVMSIVNLAHGSYYVLGAYVGYSVGKWTGSFVIAALAGASSSVLFGLFMEHFFLRYLYGKHLEQIVVTFGFVYVIMALTKLVWGRDPLIIEKAAVLAGSMDIFDFSFPIYRFAVIVIGFVIAIGLWWFLGKTRIGIAIRATVEDAQMAAGIGINVRATAITAFALGTFLAGLGGVLGGPILGIFPGLDLEILMMAIVIVVVGGGTPEGAFLGSLLIGFASIFSMIWLEELSLFVVFGAMAVVLLLRPQGLLGRE